eukprot:m.78209 g.78209  ORF g.78209 m.78209 type:complete len:235 (-) comp25093_c0_seq4:77-781(-)
MNLNDCFSFPASASTSQRQHAKRRRASCPHESPGLHGMEKLSLLDRPVKRAHVSTTARTLMDTKHAFVTSVMIEGRSWGYASNHHFPQYLDRSQVRWIDVVYNECINIRSRTNEVLMQDITSSIDHIASIQSVFADVLGVTLALYELSDMWIVAPPSPGLTLFADTLSAIWVGVMKLVLRRCSGGVVSGDYCIVGAFSEQLECAHQLLPQIDRKLRDIGARHFSVAISSLKLLT